MRTTQSGMGCPDWPKCFGKWIPPTDVSQLPANYQEIYAHRGYADTQFDAYHTWVEYVNRLLGALLGLVIFITLLFSFSIYKVKKSLFWLTFFSFILIGFQGWLGSLVVASNLAPVKITVHMIAALVLLALLIYIYDLSAPRDRMSNPNSNLTKWTYLALTLTVIQVLIGTQVREEVDTISKELMHTQRELWADKLSVIFKFHRSFSILVVLLNGWIILKSLKLSVGAQKIKFLNYLIVLLIAAEILVGVVLNYFAFPVALQPLHLLIASLLFGVQFRFMLLLK